MKLAKTILKAVWPIVYSQLKKLAQKTETPWDDAAIEGANTTIMLWLDSEWEGDED